MKTHAPPLYAMYVFTIVARHLNLTHAANELCITQGAVSRQIASLENYLDFPLFHRHARGLTLTSQAQQLLPDYCQAFHLLEQANEKIHHSETLIRLKAPTCAMRWLLPRLQFLEQHQGYQIALQTTQQHGVNFQQENVDIAIIYAHHTPQAYAVKLFDEQLVPVLAASPLSPLPAPEQWSQLNLTFLHPSPDGRDWQHWLETAGIHPKMHKNQFFETMDLAINAAIQGFGITVADIHIIEDDLRQQRLHIAANHRIQTGAAYYLVPHPQLQHRLTPFMEALKTVELH
ncbi:LysR substrate-binding domain-containing protein [Celerinatantimonas sp. YJH-8]|uniref:LysR substrate-binding domain-containing protein n=1 Tax=Celerinatantimonas sp. YJH-8 TaxID=3228714 RepID=UPI0038BECCF6